MRSVPDRKAGGASPCDGTTGTTRPVHAAGRYFQARGGKWVPL